MPAATAANKKLIGAFVQTAADADDLFRAGIPVWVIREAKWAGNDRVDSFPNKYITFGRFARGFLSYGDAYNLRAYEAPIPQSTGSEQTSSTFKIGPRVATSREIRKSKQPYPIPQRQDFSEPVSVYLPPSQEAWALGLCKINTDAKRSLLVSRSMAQAATASSSTSTRTSSKSSQRGEILQRIFENFDFHASGVAVNGHKHQVAWRGQALIKGQELDINLVREVLWELSELNFWFDLIALDHHLYCRTLKVEREGQILQSREDDILLCFAGGPLGTSPFLAHIANADIGIAAGDWMVRRAYIIYLQNAMRDWEGFDSAAKQCHEVDLFTRSSDILSFAEHQYLLFEVVLVRLFIQLFYDAFGRAPVIPRRLH
ncbi:hypothetical protein JR316_0012747 [Psilocybe cubensis]|uniref:Uncharacterized protein n=1 Tax=Psilocybe cubensis TaxID=181762 RepID=A0ACB8GIS5_PSICU|nr:hypothetical protein JR316_0012747 [Psilocybe cubensis]KAH9475630.1 hypothetical protein JR316_0012747 [Psilocybe cubensis]